MKTTMILFAFLLIAVVGNAQTADEKAVTAFMVGAQDLWNRHDINGYNNLYADDATLVNPAGAFSANKAEIVKLHLATNEHYFRYTSVAFDIQKIKFVTPEVALVNMKYNVTMTADATMPDGVKNSKGDKHSVAILHILVKKNGTWQISTTQVTPIMVHTR